MPPRQLLLVFPVAAEMTASKYQTGELVTESGIYRVLHASHRLPHTVTICKGERFPRCAKCADQVKFELIHAADCPFSYEPLHVYELHPLEEELSSSGVPAHSEP